MANNSTYYRADYTTSLYFKLPAGTNLDDTTVVEEYWIRGGILYVQYVGDDDVKEFRTKFEAEPDFKDPDKMEIEEDFYDEESESESESESEEEPQEE